MDLTIRQALREGKRRLVSEGHKLDLPTSRNDFTLLVTPQVCMA